MPAGWGPIADYENALAELNSPYTDPNRRRMLRSQLPSLKSMADFQARKDAGDPKALTRDNSLKAQLGALAKGAAVLGGGLGLAQGIMALPGNLAGGAAAGGGAAAPAVTGGAASPITTGAGTTFGGTAGTAGGVGGSAAGAGGMFGPTAGIEEMITGLTSGGGLNTTGLGTLSQQAGLAGSLGVPAAALGGGTALTTALGGAGQVLGGVAQAGQSFWDQIMESVGNDPAQAVKKAMPYLSSVAGLAEAIGGYYGDDKLADQLKQISQNADPFGSQRPGYQGRLANTFTDPNWLSKDPTLSGLTDTSYIDEYRDTDIAGKLGDESYLQSISDRIKNDVAKQMSAKGFMNSGNYGMELGQRLQQEIAPLSLQQQQALANVRGQQASNLANLQQQQKQNLADTGQRQQQFLGQLAGANIAPSSASVTAGMTGAQTDSRKYDNILRGATWFLDQWPGFGSNKP